ncbi:hypothetical protein QA634_30830 [Methylobacterium sp. CB376]|uniref:hypothetical protein n=1 Tax=unclassified Methylobacterium TaxID=2615210 RepID=UPI000152CC9E|nr:MULTISPECIES: hypothetical protein [Methylobacterium]WFT79555.1 hypothetical protein QA634_30830 [Methylobacterium nodulans]
MTNQQELLKMLVEGDIFHAKSYSGAKIMCLALNNDGIIIRARRICVPLIINFDCNTGVGKTDDDRCTYMIICISPLPADVHNEVLSIERKYRLETKQHKLALTKKELETIMFVSSFVEENSFEFTFRL